MTMDHIGVQMSRTHELKVDWGALTKTMGKVAVAGFAATFGLVPGLGGTIAALSGSLDSIKEKDDPGLKAWQLFVLSFAWALDQLRQEPGTDTSKLREEMRSLVQKAKSLVDTTTLILPTSFTERPTLLPLYVLLRDQLVEQRGAFRPNTTETPGALRARLDAAFDRGVFEVWSQRPELFASLSQALNAPGKVAAQEDIEWRVYRKSLIHDFEIKPVFGQSARKISLSQLYVPLRAVWTEDRQQDEIAHNPEGGDHDQISHLFWLDQHLDNWAVSDDSDDIRLIGGGPGSGKSTALKALARRLSERDDVRPLFIPLQHVQLSHDLRDSVNAYFTSMSDSPFRMPPLNRQSVESGPPLVLIFDGLDEIARPGSGADDIANMFVGKLNSLITALKGSLSRQVRVVLSGRTASFQAVGKYLSIPEYAKIEVHGFTPYPIDNGDEDPDQISAIDQRPQWWRQYAALAGESAETPLALTDQRLRDVTKEPLLCYLLLVSGFIQDDWEAAAENPNRIYEKLVNDIWVRGWGDGASEVKRQGAGRSLTRGDFNRLMETIALAAWLGGDTRVCSKEGFREALEITKCRPCWENFTKHGGEDIANLAMNFYLKGTEESLQGFEFTHKSFGDYLAARALCRIAQQIPNLAETRVEFAIDELMRATATGELTREILRFIRDQMRLLAKRDEVGGGLLRMKQAIEEVISAVLADGFPVQVTPKSSWRRCEVRQKNSEIMLWAIANSIFWALKSICPLEQARIKIVWPEDRKGLASLLDRLVGSEMSWSPAVLECFSGVDARDQYLFGRYIGAIDFSHCNLSQCNFSATYLVGARFRGATLDGSIFIRSNLGRAEFSGASLKDCVFNNSILLGVNLFHKTRGRFQVNRVALLSFLPTLLKDLGEGKRLHRICMNDRFNSEDEENFETVARFIIDAVVPRLDVTS